MVVPEKILMKKIKKREKVKKQLSSQRQQNAAQVAEQSAENGAAGQFVRPPAAVPAPSNKKRKADQLESSANAPTKSKSTSKESSLPFIWKSVNAKCRVDRKIASYMNWWIIKANSSVPDWMI